MTGYPIFKAHLMASSVLITSPSLPSTTGTPAFLATVFAIDLSPIKAMDFEDGPTNLIAQSSIRETKSGFSDKKPYPG